MKIASVTIVALTVLATTASAAEVIRMVGRSAFDPNRCVTAEELVPLAQSYFPEAKIDVEQTKADPTKFEVHAYVGKWHAFAEFKDGCMIGAALAK